MLQVFLFVGGLAAVIVGGILLFNKTTTTGHDSESRINWAAEGAAAREAGIVTRMNLPVKAGDFHPRK